jgi:hypothetical protein
VKVPRGGASGLGGTGCDWLTVWPGPADMARAGALGGVVGGVVVVVGATGLELGAMDAPSCDPSFWTLCIRSFGAGGAW